MKVTMVEYQGRCDTEGKAVGHAPKVLIEYYDFIKDICDVNVFAPKVILKQLPKEISANSKVLSKQIVMKGHNSFYEKIANKMHMFQNLKQAFQGSDADIVWLFNVEYYVMLYLFLHRKPKQKVVCTLFMEQFKGNGIVGKVKKYVFGQAQKKIDLIISSGENFHFSNCESKFIPDYYYQEEKYKTYQHVAKKEMAVCLGTMGDGKQLEEMVEAFNRVGYPLTIAGRFYDKQRLERLKNAAGENISIVDKYLSDAEYFDLLSQAKYTVLPYSPLQYNTQTSGVLQEAIFVNTIPVSYKAVLEGNNTLGVGFLEWSKLTKEILSGDVSNLLEQYKELRENKYSERTIRTSYSDIFSKSNM